MREGVREGGGKVGRDRGEEREGGGREREGEGEEWAKQESQIT